MTTVCIASKCFANYAKLGGHIWVYLNWALGCQLAGCRVIFLESFDTDCPDALTREAVLRFQEMLVHAGLDASVCLIDYDANQSKYVPRAELAGVDTLHLDEAVSRSDVILDIIYGLPSDIISRFRRSALIDIDPGLLQMWMKEGQLDVAPHDVYFSIGETVGKRDSLVPDCGLPWVYTPPPVDLNSWPNTESELVAPYTTVTNWWGHWVKQGDVCFNNQKRIAFVDYIDLPNHIDVSLELAVSDLSITDTDRKDFESSGWRIRNAGDVSETPGAYRQYIQASRGEFSCAKPSCMKYENAWISDRTLCYLASGKPAIVQHTGRSTFLPDSEGLFRFRTLQEAVSAFEKIEADYAAQARFARALANEHFEAGGVVNRVLEHTF